MPILSMPKSCKLHNLCISDYAAKLLRSIGILRKYCILEALSASTHYCNHAALELM